MKIKNLNLLFIAILVFSIATISCNKKSNVKLTNESDSVSYCIGVSVGENLKEANIPSFNNEAFARGVADVLNKKDLKVKIEDVNNYLNNYFAKLQQQQMEQNLKEGQDFLAKNKERKGVITTPSGLQYEVLKEGTGPQPGKDDFVKIHYKGTLIDGTVFDSSYDRNEPASISVGGVISGFSEALQLMKVGSKYKIYIPSELGNGPNVNPRSKIKPNSVLIFEVELLSIDKDVNKAGK